MRERKKRARAERREKKRLAKERHEAEVRERERREQRSGLNGGDSQRSVMKPVSKVGEAYGNAGDGGGALFFGILDDSRRNPSFSTRHMGPPMQGPE